MLSNECRHDLTEGKLIICNMKVSKCGEQEECDVQIYSNNKHYKQPVIICSDAFEQEEAVVIHMHNAPFTQLTMLYTA